MRKLKIAMFNRYNKIIQYNQKKQNNNKYYHN